MLTTIEGTYENGRVILNENPPTQAKAKVFITFLEEINLISNKKTKRPFGIMKGSVTLPDDFNEPLEDLANCM
jgi:hypothetical protein